jgi:hypothetical protein
MKKLWNREALKGFFRKGQFPTESHFGYLIDSQVNKLDDGFSKTDKDGFKLSPTGQENTVISIFSSATESDPNWQLNLKNDPSGIGLAFDSYEAKDPPIKNTRLFLAENGHVGIGTTEPQTLLDVNGITSTKTRIGSLKIGEVDGDGEYKDILSDLNGIQGFEVVAKIEGAPGRGKYAITHAIALGAFSGGTNRIQQTRSYYGWFFNRIDFRWRAVGDKYALQVRSFQHYGLKPDGTPYKIKYHICSLMDDSIFK